MPTNAIKLPAALEKFVALKYARGRIAVAKPPSSRQSRIKSVAASSSPGCSQKSRKASTPDQRLNSILKRLSVAVAADISLTFLMSCDRPPTSLCPPRQRRFAGH
jgi:hypothetical protein